MAVIYWPVYAIDSTLSGNPFVSGLTPVFTSLRTTGASPADVSSHATITPVGGGIYQIAYDAELYGEAAGVIDLTSLSTATDRYVPVGLFRDSGRIQAAINTNGKVNEVVTITDKAGYALAANGVDLVALNVEADGGSTNGDNTLLKAVRRLYRRFFRPASRNPTTISLNNNSGTPVSTIAITDDGAGTETQGMAS